MLSISFSFTVWFFTPAEIFVRNQKDFIVGAGYIIPPMLIAAVVIAAGSILLLLIHKTLFTAVSGAMTGLLLALYVQELFFSESCSYGKASWNADRDSKGTASSGTEKLFRASCYLRYSMI